MRQLVDLTGKVAIVTGAAKGIGAATARRLAEYGADVVITYRSNGDKAEAVAKELAQGGRRAIAVALNVTDPADVAAKFDQIAADFGRIDILVNNAAVYPHTEVMQIAPAEWDEVMRTNLNGSFFCAQNAARHMIAGGRGGRIVNITSVDAFAPEIGFVHYDTSKAGLAQMTRTMAQELGVHGITVNAVGPGLIEGPDIQMYVPERVAAYIKLAPVGRMGRPEEIGDAVAFFASDSAAFVTGQSLYVDGGVTLATYVWIHKQYTGRMD